MGALSTSYLFISFLDMTTTTVTRLPTPFSSPRRAATSASGSVSLAGCDRLSVSLMSALAVTALTPGSRTA
ncbi:hypothetical protein DL96DRAFT_1576369 [Flagelloscypha sp. PMI_526]|nr:hypothetical protein DL96DRAFT_1576369 [Flagelloscypha sp. PMI_526]